MREPGRYTIVNLRAALAVLLVISTPLTAQVVEDPSVPQAAPPVQETATQAPAPARKLTLVSKKTSDDFSETFTEGSLTKFVDSFGTLGNSVIYESTDGLIGIGHVHPLNALHVKIPDGATNVPLKLETSGADSISGISLKNDARNWLLRVDGTDGDKFKIFDANAAADRVTIDDAGRVGIGTNVPTQKVHAFGADNAGTIILAETTNTESGAHAAFRTTSTLSATSYVAHGNRDPSLIRFGIPLAGWGEIVNFNGNGYIVGTTLNTPLVLGTNNLERMRILGNGNVGIGTVSPSRLLHLTSSSGNAAIQFTSNTSKSWHVANAGDDFNVSETGVADARIYIKAGGNVGIGTSTPAAKLHVVGDIISTGNITGAKVIGAVYQDVAEWVPATTDIDAGTVVVLNPARNNEVMTSTHAYDTGVAGVVSAQPGILLGIEGVGKEQIATTGRVKVRVDARVKPIAVGDLLVTSDTPGTAMRSEPMSINGRPFHQPGTILGKALEPLEGGVGEILVLLSMQ
jgi:hypothetical protein